MRRAALGLTAIGALGAIASTFGSWERGIEGAYFSRSIGAPAFAGVYVFWDGGRAWGDMPGLSILIVAVACLSLATLGLNLANKPQIATWLSPVALVGAVGLAVAAAEFLAGHTSASGAALLALSAPLMAGGLVLQRGRPHKQTLWSAGVAVSGAVLIGATFLTWYLGLPAAGIYVRGDDGGTMSAVGGLRSGSAWTVFSAVDLLLLVAGLGLLAVGAAGVLGRRPGRVVIGCALGVAVAAAGFAAWRTMYPPDDTIGALGSGAGIGLASLAAGVSGLAGTLRN
jgi:hypothetical protein